MTKLYTNPNSENTQNLVIPYSEGVKIAKRLSCNPEYVYMVVKQYNQGKRRFCGSINKQIIPMVKKAMRQVEVA